MNNFGMRQYDMKALCKYLLMALVTIVLWKATAGFGAILTSILVIYAISRDKPIEMMFWVLFITLSAGGNRQIFMTNVISVLTVRATLVLLTVMLATRLLGGGREARLMTPFWGILFYIAWECVSSVQGFSPIVSYLKLFLFFSVFLSMFGVANTVNRSSRTNAVVLRSAVLALIVIIIIGSVLIIPVPSLSLMTDKAAIEAMMSGEVTSLFQGMTSHSQVMGPMAAIMATFIFADLAFSIKKWDKLYLLLLLCCPILIYKSSSRTGMGTMIAGIGMVMLLVMKAKGIGSHWKGKLMMAINTLVIVGVIAVVALPSVRGKVSKFVLKWDMSGDSPITTEDVLSSRQGKIDIALYNYRKKPLLGNGFQVSDEMQFERRSGIVDYLSAPIEKGIWLYAILEEGGAVGMILFCGWLIVLFTLLIKRHAYIGASVFFAFLTANLGEFSLFSMTYVGGFYWTFTFAAVCLDVQRMKAANMPVFFVPIEQVMEEVGYDEWVRKQG